MRETYTSDIYLDYVDLNNIENEIENVTKVVQQYFDYETMPLRNIQLGDNLSGKTIYLSFPRNLYEQITNTTYTNLVECDNGKIRYRFYNNKKYVGVSYNEIIHYIYAKNDSAFNPYLNYVELQLPNDFGVVTNINSSDNIYQYIKIYDNEMVIPDYNKHVYKVNDILTMRNVDNIEKGIQNIGDYFYKPKGWLNGKEWLGKSILDGYSNYGVSSKPISYQDLNRWVTNLRLCDFENVNKLTIWNTTLSTITWNVDNETEWEEF